MSEIKFRVPLEQVFPWLTENVTPQVIVATIFLLLIVLVLFAVVAFLQGRSVKVPLLLDIGPHPDKQQSGSASSLQVSVDTGNARIPEDQWEELLELVRSIPAQSAEADASSFQAAVSELPPVPEKIQRVLQIRWNVQQKVMTLGWGTIDGWAGISLAPPEKLLEMMRQNEYIDPELADAIGNFLFESDSASFSNDISEDRLAFIEELGHEILPRIPPPPDTPPWEEEGASGSPTALD